VEFFLSDKNYIAVMRKNAHIIIASIIFSIILWISVSLTNDYVTTYQIPIRIIDFPEEYTTGSNIPDNVNIRLRGNGWKLLTLNLGTGSEYIVSANGDSGRKMVNLFASLSENPWLTSDTDVLDIHPDTISFQVEKIISKKVKIIPDYSVQYRTGYGLASPVRVIPESTVVYGPRSVINNLSNVKTATIELNALEGRIVERGSLEAARGMTYEQDVVEVHFDVQRIVDRNFENLPVEVVDIPGDRDVVLIPNNITIGVRGGIDILGRLRSDSIRAVVYYRDVVLDTVGGVSPTLNLPENVHLLYRKPEYMRYIIKKYD
jgi:YbbR domain-containing protein